MDQAPGSSTCGTSPTPSPLQMLDDPRGRTDRPLVLGQAAVVALEEHAVSALHQQLAQAQLDSANKKAQIATLARLTSSDSVSCPPHGADPAAAQDTGSRTPTAQPQLDAWLFSVTSRPAVCFVVTGTHACAQLLMGGTPGGHVQAIGPHISVLCPAIATIGAGFCCSTGRA